MLTEFIQQAALAPVQFATLPDAVQVAETQEVFAMPAHVAQHVIDAAGYLLGVAHADGKHLAVVKALACEVINAVNKDAAIRVICDAYGNELAQRGYKAHAVRKSELKKILEASFENQGFFDDLMADKFPNAQAAAKGARKALKGSAKEGNDEATVKLDDDAAKALKALEKAVKLLEALDPDALSTQLAKRALDSFKAAD